MSDEKNSLNELLRPHVHEIIASAAAGNDQAQTVIDLYQLHLARPNDPGARALCEAAFDDWKKSAQ